jgi:putative transposase
VKSSRAEYGVSMMCQVLGVSPSGYYAWQGRRPSAHSRADAALIERIGQIHEASRRTYGVPRVHFELAAHGVRISRKRVARLMRMAGLQGVSRRKGIRTTVRCPEASPAPDPVERNFTVSEPDRLWVADITYIATWAGFLFLSVVLDAWSRRVVGWAMATHLKTELVLDGIGG